MHSSSIFFQYALVNSLNSNHISTVFGFSFVYTEMMSSPSYTHTEYLRRSTLRYFSRIAPER